ncbi:MAG: hypothetical protein GX596_02370, partial [Propionibacterium sp.]|nr:hypothetical protein [Propionibacterium sp.]
MTISTREPPAPAFEAGAVGLPWYRRAWHQGAGYLLPNLIFLALPATFVHGEVSTARYVGLLAVLALLGGLLVGTSVVAHWGERGRWVWIGLIMGSLGLLAYFGDNLSLMAYFTPYVTVAAAMLIPWRAARTVMLGVSTIG